MPQYTVTSLPGNHARILARVVAIEGVATGALAYPLRSQTPLTNLLTFLVESIAIAVLSEALNHAVQ